MAGLTGNIDFGKGGGIGIGGHRVVFLEPCGMALRAATIPVVIGSGPMQRLARLAKIVGHQLVPTLT